MKKIDNLLNEFAKEITDFYTIVIKDGNKARRYSFDVKKLDHLSKELSNNYGQKVIKGVMKEIKMAVEGNYLKNFAVDDSVDFEVKDNKLLSRIRQIDRIVTEEFAEFDGKNWKGDIAANTLGKIASYVHKKYGLLTISQLDGVPDIKYDSISKQYKVNFEPTAKDITGKLISSILIPSHLIDSQKAIPTPGIK